MQSESWERLPLPTNIRLIRKREHVENVFTREGLGGDEDDGFKNPFAGKVEIDNENEDWEENLRVSSDEDSPHPLIDVWADKSAELSPVSSSQLRNSNQAPVLAQCSLHFAKVRRGKK